MANVPVDGRLTSLNPLSLPLTGGEVLYIVSPGNAAFGNSYQVTVATLAAFMAAFPALNAEYITSGATSISPYAVLTTDTAILFRKTIPSASFAVMPSAVSMKFPGPVLFKDLKGDAASNKVTVSFTGGELCDGLGSVVIDSDYGWVRIAPVEGGGAWYQC